MGNLLIKGLNAPEKCNGCFMNLAGHCMANNGLYVGRVNLEYNSKPDWCPAMNIQLHEPVTEKETEPPQTVLTCPACASLNVETEDTLDSYTGFDNSIICWCVAHCRACGKSFSFEEVYKFTGFRNIELEEN